ncbi:MAG TPA: hypothetical protein PK765_00360 [bacterium]|nr:hypothetical protein [bacterium]
MNVACKSDLDCFFRIDSIEDDFRFGIELVPFAHLDRLAVHGVDAYGFDMVSIIVRMRMIVRSNLHNDPLILTSEVGCVLDLHFFWIIGIEGGLCFSIHRNE